MDIIKAICEVDGRHFQDSKSLYQHIKSSHNIGNTRDKDCNQCEKTFFSQHDLTTHVNKDKHSDKVFAL